MATHTRSPSPVGSRKMLSMPTPVSIARNKERHAASSCTGRRPERSTLMRRVSAFVGVLCGLVFAQAGCTQQPTAPYPERVGHDHPIVFMHVNVVPMDRDEVLADRTVMIREGRIAWIRAGDEAIPVDAVTIE